MTSIAIKALLVVLFVIVSFWAVHATHAQATSTHLDGPCIGRILITNHATGTTDVNTLHDIDGIEVGVHYTSTPNWQPAPLSHDVIVVTTPEGFMAVPSDIVLPEGDTVEVLICEALIG